MQAIFLRTGTGLLEAIAAGLPGAAAATDSLGWPSAVAGTWPWE